MRPSDDYKKEENEFTGTTKRAHSSTVFDEVYHEVYRSISGEKTDTWKTMLSYCNKHRIAGIFEEGFKP